MTSGDAAITAPDPRVARCAYRVLSPMSARPYRPYRPYRPRCPSTWDECVHDSEHGESWIHAFAERICFVIYTS